MASRLLAPACSEKRNPARRLARSSAAPPAGATQGQPVDLTQAAREKVLGLMRRPLLEPEAEYELEGYRGSVIFPCGMILEDGGEVKLYYGAADTSIALATAHVDDLLESCEPLK